jgi:hypothetical protein
MYDAISAASFRVVETLHSWHSRSSLILYHSFHLLTILELSKGTFSKLLTIILRSKSQL